MKNTVIYILFLVIVMSTILAIMFSLRTVETLEEEMSNIVSENEANPDVIYIEIPYVYYDKDLIEYVRSESYNEYMSKLSDENAEQWWYGYQILTEGWDNPPLHITDVYDENELNYLYRCVEIEVHGGDFMSKAHVAQVVFNRLDDENKVWGETLTEIITRPNQFSHGNVYVTEQTKQACAFAFEMPDFTSGAVAFHSGTKSETFFGREYVFTDSVGHHFYR